MHRDQDARDAAALSAFDAEFEGWQRRLREFVAIARRLAAARYPGAGDLIAPVVDADLVDQLRDLRELLVEFQDSAWWHALDRVATVPEVCDRLRDRGQARFRALVNALPDEARAELDDYLRGPVSAAAPMLVVEVFVTLTRCSPDVVERALAGPNAGAPAWWWLLDA